jgi:hypothetical protein
MVVPLISPKKPLKRVSLADDKQPTEEWWRRNPESTNGGTMRNRILAVLSVLLVAIGLVVAQTHRMAIHEPHMSAAYGHLQQARAELERAAPNKGGHRDRAMQAIDQAMQEIEEGEQFDQQHRGR